MSSQEKNIYVSISVTLLVFGVYVFKMLGYFEAGLFEQPNGLKLLGKSILILIGIMAAANIVAQILSSILFAALAKNCNPDFQRDERDKQIELKGMQLSYAVFGAGLILTMILLTAGWAGAPLAFNLIIGSIVFAEIVGNLKKLYHYNRGF